jgi:hypothetical protein
MVIDQTLQDKIEVLHFKRELKDIVHFPAKVRVHAGHFFLGCRYNDNGISFENAECLEKTGGHAGKRMNIDDGDGVFIFPEIAQSVMPVFNIINEIAVAGKQGYQIIAQRIVFADD